MNNVITSMQLNVARLQAIEYDQAEPWAHHAMAHVHLTRGSISKGKSFLQERADSWDGLNSFMFTHNLVASGTV